MKLLTTLTAIGLAMFAVADNASAAPASVVTQIVPKRFGGLKASSVFKLKVKVADNPFNRRPNWYPEQDVRFRIGKNGELVVGGVWTPLVSSTATENIYESYRRKLTLTKKNGRAISVKVETSFLYQPMLDDMGAWKTGYTFFYLERK